MCLYSFGILSCGALHALPQVNIRYTGIAFACFCGPLHFRICCAQTNSARRATFTSYLFSAPVLTGAVSLPGAYALKSRSGSDSGGGVECKRNPQSPTFLNFLDLVPQEIARSNSLCPKPSYAAPRIPVAPQSPQPLRLKGTRPPSIQTGAVGSWGARAGALGKAVHKALLAADRARCPPPSCGGLVSTDQQKKPSGIIGATLST